MRDLSPVIFRGEHDGILRPGGGFNRLLNSLPKSASSEDAVTKQGKQKVLGVKGVHHKRNKGRRR